MTRVWSKPYFQITTLAAFVLGVALVTVPVLYWDSMRWAVAPSPWDLSVRNYAAITLLNPLEWPERVALWSPLLWELTASWLSLLAISTLVIGGGVASVRATIRQS